MKTLLCLFMLLPLFACSQGQMLKFEISVVDDLGYPLPNVLVFAQGEYVQNPGDPDLSRRVFATTDTNGIAKMLVLPHPKTTLGVSKCISGTYLFLNKPSINPADVIQITLICQ